MIKEEGTSRICSPSGFSPTSSSKEKSCLESFELRLWFHMNFFVFLPREIFLMRFLNRNILPCSLLVSDFGILFLVFFLFLFFLFSYFFFFHFYFFSSTSLSFLSNLPLTRDRSRYFMALAFRISL